MKRVLKKALTPPEPEPVVKGPKVVSDMSGHCRFAAECGDGERKSHRTCHGEWDTPSVHVVCSCPCHTEALSSRVRRVVRRTK